MKAQMIQKTVEYLKYVSIDELEKQLAGETGISLPEQSLAKIIAGVESGDPVSEYHLAKLLLFGDNSATIRYDHAFTDSIAGRRIIVRAYILGNVDVGIEFLEKSCRGDDGLDISRILMAEIYTDGLFGKKSDHIKAEELISSSARKGIKCAQNLYGSICAGNEENKYSAVSWFKQCEDTIPDATYNIYVYEEQNHPGSDHSDLLKKAHEKGDSIAVLKRILIEMNKSRAAYCNRLYLYEQIRDAAWEYRDETMISLYAAYVYQMVKTGSDVILFETGRTTTDVIDEIVGLVERSASEEVVSRFYTGMLLRSIGRAEKASEHLEYAEHNARGDYKGYFDREPMFYGAFINDLKRMCGSYRTSHSGIWSICKTWNTEIDEITEIAESLADDPGLSGAMKECIRYELLNNAVNRGDIPAIGAYLKMYYDREVATVKHKKAIWLLRSLYNNRTLGFYNEHGVGECITCIAQTGDAFHIGLLGECYINGFYGFPICEKTGFQYLVKAAQKGEAIYMREVGTCLINGTGIEKDIKTGLSWFIKASKAGCASAKVELGKCYEYGLFNETPRDFQTAQAYYTQAIALGDRDAEYLRLHLWLTQGNNPTHEEAKDSLIERMRSGDLRAKDMLKNYAREIKHYRWYLRIRLDMIKDMVNRWTADRRLSRYSCLRIGGETR